VENMIDPAYTKRYKEMLQMKPVCVCSH